MKKDLSKSGAEKKIDSFFSKSGFSKEGAKKMKRLAMKYNIKLKEERKKFCKKCLSPLKGKTRISGHQKSVLCQDCGFRNKFRIGTE